MTNTENETTQSDASTDAIRMETGSLVSVLGVVYVHHQTADGGDMYLTQFGLAYREFLELANWHDDGWFTTHRERLEGTSAVYRTCTREINGRHLDLVVKNSRVGEDVPLETRTLMEFINAEFNSPWEEFALVMEMRDGRHGPRDIRIQTQVPLAIYVPPERMQMWQSGRSVEKISRIHARHPGVDLDILRQYKLIYAWIPGTNVVELLISAGLRGRELNERVTPITLKATNDMAAKGFVMADMKPVHVIVGDADAKRLATMAAAGNTTAFTGQLADIMDACAYSIVDYELVTRTGTYAREVAETRRHSYLDDQRDRFAPTDIPAHLAAVTLLGVPYIHGAVRSTGGELWVVGRNARLFDYFLPERWRGPTLRLSTRSEVNYTLTKDNVHLVWKISRVGETPAYDAPDAVRQGIQRHGYNSPFEEYAIAQRLAANGVPTVYMRAIYMTRSRGTNANTDRRRYESLPNRFPPVAPVLREDCDYIMLRGYYNGPDEWVAARHGTLLRPLDVRMAMQKGVLTAAQATQLMADVRQRMLGAGFDGSLLDLNDLLLALGENGVPILRPDGSLDVRVSNLELVWPV